MRTQIGVDTTFGVIHRMEITPANTYDIPQAEHLLHGKEKTCWDDAGYKGV